MRSLPVKRYKQDHHHCVIASSAALANFYNPLINYTLSKKIARSMYGDLSEGLYSAEAGSLLNRLGFRKVTIFSTDLDYFDYQWKNLSRKTFLKRIQSCRFSDRSKCHVLRSFKDFLADNRYDNNLVIDYRFGKYIRESLDQGHPVMLSFNWNIYFELPKRDYAEAIDPWKGEAAEHMVVACGYDKRGVSIVDSHHRYYTGQRSRFAKGRYVIKWEELMTVIGRGDVLIPTDYDPTLVKP